MNFNHSRASLYFLANITVLAGCNSLAERSSIPAVIQVQTETASAEVYSTVLKALNVSHILLAPDALIRSNKLIIERKQHRTLQQGVLMGRTTEKPEIFELFIEGNDCFLRHFSSKRAWKMLNLNCIPAN